MYDWISILLQFLKLEYVLNTIALIYYILTARLTVTQHVTYHHELDVKNIRKRTRSALFVLDYIMMYCTPETKNISFLSISTSCDLLSIFVEAFYLNISSWDSIKPKEMKDHVELTLRPNSRKCGKISKYDNEKVSWVIRIRI